jgi:hypothetical protein
MSALVAHALVLKILHFVDDRHLGPQKWIVFIQSTIGSIEICLCFGDLRLKVPPFRLKKGRTLRLLRFGFSVVHQVLHN